MIFAWRMCTRAHTQTHLSHSRTLFIGNEHINMCVTMTLLQCLLVVATLIVSWCRHRYAQYLQIRDINHWIVIPGVIHTNHSRSLSVFRISCLLIMICHYWFFHDWNYSDFFRSFENSNKIEPNGTGVSLAFRPNHSYFNVQWFIKAELRSIANLSINLNFDCELTIDKHTHTHTKKM